MRNRKKVQCESYESIYNNNFQKKSEMALHRGKRVNNPANPFVASISNAKLNVLENVSFTFLFYYYSFDVI